MTCPRHNVDVESYPLLLWDLLILYRRDRDEAHALNPSAQAIWQLCDGRSSVGQIADALERFLAGADVHGLRADVEAAVEALTERGLLEPG